MKKPSPSLNGGAGPLLTGDRPMPHNLDAEKAVLGCILTDPDTLKEAAVRLNFDGAFYSASHQTIFSTIIEMANPKEGQGQPIDLITVSEALTSKSKLAVVGGDSYLAELMNIIPTTANIENYVKIVHEYAVLRRLIRASSDVIQKCFDAEGQVNFLLDEVQQEISEVANLQTGKDAESISDFMKPAIDYLLQLNDNSGDAVGIPTGFKDLDNMITGLKGGDMIVLAARPSIGKTAFALNIAANVALRAEKAVGIFSLEMNTLSLVLRLLCSEAKLNVRELKQGVMSHSRWVEVTAAADRLRKAQIFIDDTGQLDVIEMRAKARRMKEKSDIQFIVIDYLQLMKGAGGSSTSREQEVAQMSGGIKALAKELDVPILILAQLNRQAEGSDRPKLSHLRESGAIEQDADIVAILHRERELQQTSDPVEMARNGLESELIIAKHRNGETGIIDLVFMPAYTQFMDKSRIAEDDVPDI
ncbi:MAG: replicative DNA helicase [Lentisphaeraceae bacterium]|nr:replicative DNA helicase [Lentisphaeraceae bacterium]